MPKATTPTKRQITNAMGVVTQPDPRMPPLARAVAWQTLMAARGLSVNEDRMGTEPLGQRVIARALERGLIKPKPLILRDVASTPLSADASHPPAGQRALPRKGR